MILRFVLHKHNSSYKRSNTAPTKNLLQNTYTMYNDITQKGRRPNILQLVRQPFPKVV